MERLIKRIKEAFIAERYISKQVMKTAPVYYMIYMFILLISEYCPIIITFLWKIFVDTLTAAKISEINKTYLTIIVCLYLGLMFVNNVSGYLSSYILLPNIHDKLNYRLDINIMKRVSEIDISFYDHPERRDMLEVVKNSKTKIVNNIDYLYKIIFVMLAFVSALLTLCSYSVTYTILFCITCIPGAYVDYVNQRAMDMFSIDNIPAHREKNYYRSLLTGNHYAKELRLYDLADYFKEKYNQLWNQIRLYRTKLYKKGTYRVFVASLIRNFGIILIMIMSINSIMDGKMPLGTLTLFTGLFAAINSYIIRLFSGIPFHLNCTIPYITKYIEFMKYTDYVDKKEMGEMESFPEIEFRNVYFKYPNTNTYVLENMSFKIKSKEKVALVGINGAGKSTIIKLILRFYDPESGEVLVGGKNVKSYSVDELYSVFGVCFQNITKYALTVKDNVILSLPPDARTEKRFKDVIELAGVDKFVDDLPNGYETELTRKFSADGYEPSLGQWQKIAIARALFRGANITILDEPSSALDPESEELVFSSFRQLYKQNGGIIVSHRLSSITMVDRIFFIEKGTIAESGSHAELMQLNGRYAKLYHMQADKYKISE